MKKYLFSSDYVNCQAFINVINNFGQVFYTFFGGCGVVASTICGEPPKEMYPIGVIFQHAVLFDQYLMDQFILPLVKYRLDYEFKLFMTGNDSCSNSNNSDKRKSNCNGNNNNNSNNNSWSNYKNILLIMETCINMQNNILRIMKKIDEYIVNYKNGTFKKNIQFDWAFSSVKQQIKKLEIVKDNLVKLNFDGINSIFKQHLKQSLNLWNNIDDIDIKTEIRSKMEKFREISHEITNKMIPKEWPVNL